MCSPDTPTGGASGYDAWFRGFGRVRAELSEREDGVSPLAPLPIAPAPDISEQSSPYPQDGGKKALGGVLTRIHHRNPLALVSWPKKGMNHAKGMGLTNASVGQW